MIDENNENKKYDGETVKSSSVWTNKNGQKSQKTVTTKKIVNGGKVKE